MKAAWWTQLFSAWNALHMTQPEFQAWMDDRGLELRADLKIYLRERR
jgi:hypothetical protein